MEEVKRIPGDLVIYTSLMKEHVAEICEVCETSYLVRFMYGNFTRVTSKEIKPITLTPEILEKNGFAKQIGAETTSYHNVEYRLKLECFNYQNYIRYRVYYENKCTSLDIKFVHQLQHLLFGLGLSSDLKV